MQKITFIFLGIGFTSSSKSQVKKLEPKQANGENSEQNFFFCQVKNVTEHRSTPPLHPLQFPYPVALQRSAGNCALLLILWCNICNAKVFNLAPT